MAKDGMFELDLLVRMKIMIPVELNARLEAGEEEAYIAVEKHLKDSINSVVKNDPDFVTALQIEDAGEYNDAGQWEPSKFHGG
jgi:hypothetical protein